MGRRKIEIKPLEGKKTRIDTFHKRKIGLVKKAAELSMLCNIKLILAFEDLSGEVFKYSTHGIFEPHEYFKEAWYNSAYEKTSDDYPDFFSKVFKRRKKGKGETDSNAADGDDNEGDNDNEIEIDCDEEKSDREPKIIVNHTPAETGSDQRMQIERQDSVAELLEEFGKRFSRIAGIQGEELLENVSKSIEMLKRGQTVNYENPSKNEIIQRSRRRTIETSTPVIDGKMNGSPHMSRNPSFVSYTKKNTLDLDSSHIRKHSPFNRSDIKDDIIFEEPEPELRDKTSYISNHIKGNNSMDMDFLPLPGQTNFFSRYQVPQADIVDFSNNLINNQNGIVLEGPEMNQDQMMGGLFGRGNKSDSDQSPPQFEVSRNNTKDFWLNLSRGDGSIDQSGMLKEEQDFDVPPLLGKMENRLNPDGGNSGLMLFSPIPMTSMTMNRKAENNMDWLAFSLKTQQEQKQFSFELPNQSFQSEPSIMKSPRLEKHIKDF